MREFYVSVVATTATKNMDPEDRAVLGTYWTQVQDDSLTAEMAAGAVLNQFHDQFGINVLDDVAITVHDDQGALLAEDEDTPRDLLANDLERVEAMPRTKKARKTQR